MAKGKKILKKVSKIASFSNKEGHVWQFSRIGGVNRVNLETGQDLVALEQLDQKLWTALSCPIQGLEIDIKTLELIDSDNDGKIRVPEILQAVKWITSVINNPDDLIKESTLFPLSAINTQTEEGENLLAAAKQILSNIGKPDAKELTVEETSDREKIFADTAFNGDGVITVNSTSDVNLQQVIKEIIEYEGSTVDLSGVEGVTSEQIGSFYTYCQEYSDWYAKAESNKEKILPYGDTSDEAYKAMLAIQPKMEDYFLRCRMAEFDEESIKLLNSLNTQYEELSKKNLNACLEEIADFPLTKINPKQILSLKKGINPVWKETLEQFNQLVVYKNNPNKEHLTEEEWKAYVALFNDYKEWLSEKAGEKVEKLELTYIRELLSNQSKENLLSLVEQDLSLETNTKHILLVDKLTRYYRDIYVLLKNYVTFSDFYSSTRKAIFQNGCLYVEQRRCDLCIKVNDMSKHNQLAKKSAICLIYCDCVSKTKNEKITIAAALTDGDFDDIEEGRNALFYDREGNDWDATIVKVIDNPISIKQAFWMPYRKVSRFITKQTEKFATSKEETIETAAQNKIEAVNEKADDAIVLASESQDAAKQIPQPKTPPPPFDIGKFVGIFAALSLAIGAIGTVLVSIFSSFFGLKWWQMPLAIIGVVLSISGPSMILAWLKLRKRNLAPLLDANGWAINARATINIVFGKTLTHLAKLPENSKLNLVDPFAKKKNPTIPIVIALIVAATIVGYLLWYFKIFTF